MGFSIYFLYFYVLLTPWNLLISHPPHRITLYRQVEKEMVHFLGGRSVNAMLCKGQETLMLSVSLQVWMGNEYCPGTLVV